MTTQMLDFAHVLSLVASHALFTVVCFLERSSSVKGMCGLSSFHLYKSTPRRISSIFISFCVKPHSLSLNFCVVVHSFRLLHFKLLPFLPPNLYIICPLLLFVFKPSSSVLIMSNRSAFFRRPTSSRKMPAEAHGRPFARHSSDSTAVSRRQPFLCWSFHLLSSKDSP